jgi:hypothetical protein
VDRECLPELSRAEILQGQLGTSESDVFRLVVVWELAAGFIPFAGKIAAQIQAARRGRIRLTILNDMTG